MHRQPDAPVGGGRHAVDDPGRKGKPVSGFEHHHLAGHFEFRAPFQEDNPLIVVLLIDFEARRLGAGDLFDAGPRTVVQGRKVLSRWGRTSGEKRSARPLLRRGGAHGVRASMGYSQSC